MLQDDDGTITNVASGPKPIVFSKRLGILEQVNTPAPDGRSRIPDMYECHFDSGAIVYLTAIQFLAAQFEIERHN